MKSSEIYLFGSNGESNEADALDGLAPEQLEFVGGGVLNDVLEAGHQSVVVGNELLLGCVGHRGDGRHHLLQHQLGAFFNQLHQKKKINFRRELIEFA
jgi:hypothetical protein